MKTFAIVMLAAGSLLAQAPVKWEHDLATAQLRARSEKKPIFIDLWAEWCPPCQHLQKNVFPSPEAQRALKNYIPLSIMTQYKNRQSIPENMKLAERFRLEAFPTLVVLDADGKEVRRQEGAFRTGQDLAAWLDGKKE